MSRLQPINPDAATGRAKGLLDAVKDKMGRVPNITRLLANSPAALQGYLSFSGALAGGNLEPQLRERIAIAVARANSCDYCLSAHTALGQMVGLSTEELDGAQHGQSGDERAAAALSFATKLVRERGWVTDEDVAALRQAGFGDGDTAMEEATFLTRYVSRVTVIHRRDTLRASKIMQEKAFKNEKIDFIFDAEVIEVLGNQETGVTGVRLLNAKMGEESEFACEGVFVAIGYKPNTEIFEGQLELDGAGYIKTEGKTMATSVPGVFACGDVQDSSYRQAVTAAGTGCMAAIDAERFLDNVSAESIGVPTLADEGEVVYA